MPRTSHAPLGGHRSTVAVLASLLLAVLAALVVPPVPAHAADTTRPYLSFIRTTVGPDSVVVQWWTDEPATGQASYGPTTAYGRTTSKSTSLTLQHALVQTGLKPGTEYHLQLRSTDAAGNTGVSADKFFTTATAVAFNPGNQLGAVPVPGGLGLEDASSPDHVVGNGTAASCTSAAVVSAVKAGGVVTFRCGPDRVTITMDETLKVRNSTARLVLDGGGKVTLSGGGVRRILYVDTCDTSLGAVSGNCLYAPAGPRVTVQNLSLTEGNATNASYVSPGDTTQGSNGGGAIFQLGGHLKVVRSFFTENRCATDGPDLGGGAIRVLAQHSPTPNDLDASYAARNQEPVTIAQSTFAYNSCSNGGAISGLRTPITVVDGLIFENRATGCCANPPHSGTPGGGSGGAVYTDGTSYDLRVLGSRIQSNTAKAGGSAIFYVSNDRTGHLAVQDTTSERNQYLASGYSPSDQHFETYPGIFYLGNGSPSFTRSTIK